MRSVAVAVLACVAVAAPAGAAPAPQPGSLPPAEVEIITPRPFSVKKDPPIPITWRADLEAAKAEAARVGRPVLLFFHADWCLPCKWMDQGTFASPRVAQYVLKQFVPVKVDDSQEKSPESKLYEIRVYPTVLFLDPGGQPLHIILGPRPPDKFEPLLKQVAELPGLMAIQKRSPNDLEANFSVGNAFAKLNQLKRAAPYLQRAVELAPNNENGRRSQASLILAVVPLEEGDSALALRNIDAFLTQFKDAPEVPVAIHFQGAILFQDGKYEEARQYFVKILREFPTHPKAYEADRAIEAIDARLKAKEAAEKQKAAPAPKPANEAADLPKKPLG